MILYDGINTYLGLYQPNTGQLSSMPIPEGDETSRVFWSPDQKHIAYIGKSGVISIINLETMGVANIDQTTIPGFIDWATDSRRIAYLSGCRDEYSPVEVWSIDMAKLAPTNVLYGFTFYSLDWSPAR